MKHIVVRLRKAYKQSLQQSDLKTFVTKVSYGTVPQAIKDVSLILTVMLWYAFKLQLFPVLGSITS